MNPKLVILFVTSSVGCLLLGFTLGYTVLPVVSQFQYSTAYNEGYTKGYSVGLNQQSPSNIKLIIVMDTMLLTLKGCVYLINVGLGPADFVRVQYEVIDQDGGLETSGIITLDNVKNGEIHERDFTAGYELGDTTLTLNITLEYRYQTNWQTKICSKTLNIAFDFLLGFLV